MRWYCQQMLLLCLLMLTLLLRLFLMFLTWFAFLQCFNILQTFEEVVIFMVTCAQFILTSLNRFVFNWSHSRRREKRETLFKNCMKEENLCFTVVYMVVECVHVRACVFVLFAKTKWNVIRLKSNELNKGHF